MAQGHGTGGELRSEVAAAPITHSKVIRSGERAKLSQRFSCSSIQRNVGNKIQLSRSVRGIATDLKALQSRRGKGHHHPHPIGPLSRNSPSILHPRLRVYSFRVWPFVEGGLVSWRSGRSPRPPSRLMWIAAFFPSAGGGSSRTCRDVSFFLTAG